MHCQVMYYAFKPPRQMNTMNSRFYLCMLRGQLVCPNEQTYDTDMNRKIHRPIFYNQIIVLILVEAFDNVGIMHAYILSIIMYHSIESLQFSYEISFTKINANRVFHKD